MLIQDDADALVVLEAPQDLRGGAAFESWLYSTTRNAAIDVCRQRARIARNRDRSNTFAGEESCTGSDPDERLDAARVSDLVRTYLTELPGRQREICDLVDLQGADPAEVARMLGLRPATVRTHLFRARRALRSRLLAGHPALKEGLLR